ncbi:P-type Ca(2+) transporter [Malassezia vespertilionis]|uniref:Calcium-transporting ATPase n=1 Tax=Malassezia vespertilionis TaxID=2020962 RepID=A0A2N1JFL0_9BASI|nr:P-type Ca(2+) transporter [Malassezia vespertilionis]PKI85337.1 Pmr1p [Malassezia vespertilionis]WFD04910.1 P-type Ca(2+) transporter [Malassezia vespertilionis]
MSQAHAESDTPYAAQDANGDAQKCTVYFMQCTVQQTLDELRVPSLKEGLSSAAVEHERKSLGTYNELASGPKAGLWDQWMEQFKEPMNLLLLGSAAVSILVGQVDDAITITLALSIVIAVGVVQEYRSEKSLEALSQLVPPKCHVLRNGSWSDIFARELVPGDIVHVGAGDRVPADLRIADAQNLEMDESALTGEVQPVRKSTKEIKRQEGESDDPAINDRTNSAYMGTLVRNGSGLGIVVAIGPATEFGSIFGMVDQVTERQTPMQRSMGDLARRISIASLCVIGVILLLGLFQRQPLLEMFTIAVSLAVAAIPEGLPIVITVTLALGALRMSHQNAIIKKLPSVETLGCVSVICSDKTGTLTANEMRVVQCFTLHDGIVDVPKETSDQAISPSLRHCLEIGNVCNNTQTNDHDELVGQPTETAMIAVLPKFKLQDARDRFVRTHEIPFRSDVKMMSVTGYYKKDGANSACTYVKGAPDFVLQQCNAYQTSDGKSASMTDAVRKKINDTLSDIAKNGLRVLAMATAAQKVTDLTHAKYTFCGFEAMRDPPREGVEDAIKVLHSGRIKVCMVTGDAEVTAVAIAKELGILETDDSKAVLTGAKLESMTDRQLQERVRSVSVFARTAPEHKLRIVAAWQANDAVVGMTGDGVNDAPALKLADVGIAMGQGGTDVTKEAADMILVDDNFATILSAVREGKSIFYNIQNFVSFQLSTSAAALFLIAFSTLIGLRFPLNAMQILFINILMDGPPSQSLGVDPPTEKVMTKPPRPIDAPVLTRELAIRSCFSAAVIIGFTFFVFIYERSIGGMDARTSTMTFTCFVLLDLVSVFQNRGLFMGLFANHMLLWTVSGSFSALLLIVYFPPLQAIFLTEALALRDLSFLFVLAGCAFALQEVRREYGRHLASRTDQHSGYNSLV